eukprot:9480348-Prorocentrum_lima.AAC.1
MGWIICCTRAGEISDNIVMATMLAAQQKSPVEDVAGACRGDGGWARVGLSFSPRCCCGALPPP